MQFFNDSALFSNLASENNFENFEHFYMAIHTVLSQLRHILNTCQREGNCDLFLFEEAKRHYLYKMQPQ